MVHVKIYIYEIFICEIHMFAVCTHFVHCIQSIQSLQFCMILMPEFRENPENFHTLCFKADENIGHGYLSI